MKHYIYLDKEILNSYISQIYGGIIEKGHEEQEMHSDSGMKSESPSEKVRATVNGGLKNLLSGELSTEYELKEKEETTKSISNISKEVVEKIYHDNLLDNLIAYINEKENVVNNIEDVKAGSFVDIEIPFNFVNHEYLKSISNKVFKDSYEKIMNSLNPNSINDIKAAKKGMELIGNFTNFFDSCFPVKQLIISNNLIIPINNLYLREDPNVIEFKYGGNIKLIGKVTKDCSKDKIEFGLYNEEFGKSLECVKDSMYNLFLPTYSNSFIVTPIALYFE